MKKRILVTDDDESMQEIFRLIFEKAGYYVDIYSEADSIYENTYKTPDIFLLDRQLRENDGLEVCAFLKKQDKTKDIPVIIVSATANIGELSQNAGADDFMEKPFHLNELLKKVARLI